MVINHLEKLFVTNDAATIIRELEVRWLFISLWKCCWNYFLSNLQFHNMHYGYDSYSTRICCCLARW